MVSIFDVVIFPVFVALMYFANVSPSPLTNMGRQGHSEDLGTKFKYVYGQYCIGSKPSPSASLRAGGGTGRWSGGWAGLARKFEECSHWP